MDRTEVISKLSELLEYSKYNDSVGWNPDSDTETLEAAIALLKAQEPVEPYTKRDGRITFFLCGGCNKPLCIARDSYKPKYCPECGLKVMWE